MWPVYKETNDRGDRGDSYESHRITFTLSSTDKQAIRKSDNFYSDAFNIMWNIDMV